MHNVAAPGSISSVMSSVPATTLGASVIVCSYNRAQLLVKTLEALRRQSIPAGLTWEVIVVDNNSRDDTRQVVERAAASWPELRYEFEPKQGLSHARNRGVRCARGKTILFTDDDVLPEPDWVEQALAGLERFQADACGGYIAPIWEEPPPAWPTSRFHGFLAIRMEENRSYEMGASSQTPFGANMAMRRGVFDRVGLFDTSRGRVGDVLASGEDGEIFDRILGSGARVVFLHDARVHHRIEAFRLHKRYFRRWCMQTSRNLVQNRGLPGERTLFGIPYYVFPQFVRAVVRALTARLAGPPDQAFFKEILVWHFIGLMQGLYRNRSLRQ